jgi:hypothetical protein
MRDPVALADPGHVLAQLLRHQHQADDGLLGRGGKAALLKSSPDRHATTILVANTDDKVWRARGEG